MELDELKGKVDFTNIRYSKAELESIFQLRAKGNIQSVNRKMLVDALLMSLVTFTLVAITFLIGLRSRYIISLEIVSFALILLTHYRIKYVLINKFNLQEHDIKNALKQVYNTFRFYWIAYHWLVPSLVGFLTIQLLRDLGYSKASPISIAIILTSILLSLLITNQLVVKIYGKEYKNITKIYRCFHTEFK